MIQGVVFDLGETLIRFEGDSTRVFEESRRELVRSLCEDGLEIPEREFSESFRRRIERSQDEREEDLVERSSFELLAETLAEFGMTDVPRNQMEAALARMFSVSEAVWQPMPNLLPVLEAVRAHGVRLGIISNASDVANVHRLIDKAGIRSYFRPILVSAGVGLRKPAVAIFETLLADWGLAPHQTVMVGDTLGADILGAQRAGMHQIWLRTAAERADNQEMANVVVPERSVEGLSEVPDVIGELARGAAASA